MLKEIMMNTFKRNYTNGTWTREEVEEKAQKAFAKGNISQKSLDDLQEFFEPTEELTV